MNKKEDFKNDIELNKEDNYIKSKSNTLRNNEVNYSGIKSSLNKKLEVEDSLRSSRSSIYQKNKIKINERFSNLDEKENIILKEDQNKNQNQSIEKNDTNFNLNINSNSNSIKGKNNFSIFNDIEKTSVFLGKYSFKTRNKIKYFMVYFSKTFTIKNILMIDCTELTNKDNNENENKLKNKILSKIGHEFKTPLNNIIGIIGIISITDERLSKEMNLILSLTNFIIFLVNDIILYASDENKISDNNILSLNNQNKEEKILSFKKINITNCLLFTFDILFALLSCNDSKKRNVKIELRIEKQIKNIEILSEEFKIYQILINFVTNSLKFTKEGRILIIASIIKRNDLEYLRISCVDTGVGIPIKIQKNLFSENLKMEIDSQFNSKGSCLGLSICRKLAEKLKILLEFSTKENIGSEFSIIFPIKKIMNDDNLNEDNLNNEPVQIIVEEETKYTNDKIIDLKSEKCLNENLIAYSSNLSDKLNNSKSLNYVNPDQNNNKEIKNLNSQRKIKNLNLSFSQIKNDKSLCTPRSVVNNNTSRNDIIQNILNNTDEYFSDNKSKMNFTSSFKVESKSYRMDNSESNKFESDSISMSLDSISSNERGSILNIEIKEEKPLNGILEEDILNSKNKSSKFNINNYLSKDISLNNENYIYMSKEILNKNKKEENNIELNGENNIELNSENNIKFISENNNINQDEYDTNFKYISYPYEENNDIILKKEELDLMKDIYKNNNKKYNQDNFDVYEIDENSGTYILKEKIIDTNKNDSKDSKELKKFKKIDYFNKMIYDEYNSNNQEKISSRLNESFPYRKFIEKNIEKFRKNFISQESEFIFSDISSKKLKPNDLLKNIHTMPFISRSKLFISFTNLAIKPRNFTSNYKDINSMNSSSLRLKCKFPLQAHRSLENFDIKEIENNSSIEKHERDSINISEVELKENNINDNLKEENNKKIEFRKKSDNKESKEFKTNEYSKHSCINKDIFNMHENNLNSSRLFSSSISLNNNNIIILDKFNKDNPKFSENKLYFENIQIFTIYSTYQNQNINKNQIEIDKEKEKDDFKKDIINKNKSKFSNRNTKKDIDFKQDTIEKGIII